MQNQQTNVTGAVVGRIALGLCVGLIIAMGLTWRAIGELREDVRLLRTVSPGRTKAQVVAWMGENYRLAQADYPGARPGETMMVYPSTRERSEDIWIVLDDSERVVAVFYPDYPTDRALLSDLQPGGR
ncbi:MAG: hypothetical protein R6V19_09740 [Armatimonadota bacterium]